MKPSSTQAASETTRVLLQPVAQLGRGLDQLERGEARRDDGRGEAVREEVWPRPLPEELDDLGSARDVPAARPAHRLAERPRDDVDPLGRPKARRRSAAARPDDTDRVRVVDHHERIVSLGELTDLVEPGQVAVHREDPVGRDQAATRSRGLLEARRELVHVAVCVAKPLGLAEANPIDDRGVIELVRDDGVLLAQ